MNDMLRHHEIQRCIDDVNEQMSAEHNRLYRSYLLDYLGDNLPLHLPDVLICALF